MPAILTVAAQDYFFASTAQASKALELLSKATAVERDYQNNTYREIPSEGREYRHNLSVEITKQRTPTKPQLRLPGA